jgi:hypothetical protein
MSACPFCGAIAEKSNDAVCPRCKMENTALTRQATRARIGPWYVMQSRNPSAPGMKCNTLLALIRKGQVTPRSVIRGPTTFQLWRFAARVKGISREFGVCYSCGAELQRTSTFCPRCSRSQELPPNPDVLLETEPQASKPIFREVNRPADPREVAEAEQPSPPRPADPVDGDSNRSPRPASQIPSAAETMAQLAEMPSPHDAPPELQTRPRQRPQEGVLTPRELAAAFSLQYDPTMDNVALPGRRRPGNGLITAAILLVAIGGAASTFYFVPSLRERFVAWVQDTQPPAADSSATTAALPKPQAEHSTPPWMVNVPDDVPPVTTAAKAPVSQPPSAQPSSPVAMNTPAPSEQVTTPAPTPAPAPVKAVVAPPAVVEPVPPPPQDNSSTVAAQANAEKLRQSAGGDLDELAMELRSNGMDAEARQDYTAAEYYYRQVENLPRDHWPGDIDQLLKNVEKHLAGAGDDNH